MQGGHNPGGASCRERGFPATGYIFFPGITLFGMWCGKLSGRRVTGSRYVPVPRSGNYPEVLSQVEIKRSKALPGTPPACNQPGLMAADFFSIPVKPGEDPL